MNQQALSSLIWSVADLLRGDFKQSEYGRVILPFTVLRRLDCVLAPTKEAVLKEHADKQKAGIAFEPFVKRKTGLDFYNVSSLDMGKLMGDQDNIRATWTATSRASRRTCARSSSTSTLPLLSSGCTRPSCCTW
jgi:type I restriction enzyme M protein